MNETVRSSPIVKAFEVAGLSIKGTKVKRQNEDSFLMNPESGLFAVADGMGGYPGGDLASHTAMETLKEVFQSPQVKSLSSSQALIRALQAANFVIYDHASQNPALFGMGTTVVALFFKGTLGVAHVGDSRAYVLRNQKLKALTEDHAVTEDCSDGSFKSTLSRAVGCDESVKVESKEVVFEQGDLFLLCSDGLTCSLNDRDLERILNASLPLKEKIENLVRAATLSGSTDDITVILIRVLV
ncbi:MAG: PP2C family protein-serine/threonine phosphatase [Pseudomonadota bacterium]